MLRHTLKIRWAGPAVALALLAAAVPSRVAAAARAAPAAPSRPAATAPAALPCVFEATAFGQAAYEWYEAFEEYMNALPGGTESEISAAAGKLDQATTKVVDTGTTLLLCLAAQLE